jgi:hypothetical protein
VVDENHSRKSEELPFQAVGDLMRASPHGATPGKKASAAEGQEVCDLILIGRYRKKV